MSETVADRQRLIRSFHDASMLFPVLAWRHAGLFPKALAEMTMMIKAHTGRNGTHRFVAAAQPLRRLRQPILHKIPVRRRVQERMKAPQALGATDIGAGSKHFQRQLLTEMTGNIMQHRFHPLLGSTATQGLFADRYGTAEGKPQAAQGCQHLIGVQPGALPLQLGEGLETLQHRSVIRRGTMAQTGSSPQPTIESTSRSAGLPA